jgi:hypothetical protein
MKRQFLAIIIICILSISTINVSARGLSIVSDEPRVGIVIDIIDGEALKVLYLSTLRTVPEVVQIKLIGQHTNF